jgi:hypothetical protein
VSTTARLAVLSLLAAALIASGCGADETTTSVSTATSPQENLTREELTLIERAEAEVAAYCRGVAAAVARGEAPNARSFARVTLVLEQLGELAAAKPDSETGDGSSPRLALGDIAENLEGTNCDARLVARIDEALARIP